MKENGSDSRKKQWKKRAVQKIPLNCCRESLATEVQTKRVEQLTPDSWLTYRDRASGQRKRMQLAWVSDDKDRYIFVNERGQKIADLSAVTLARQLSQQRTCRQPLSTSGGTLSSSATNSNSHLR